MGSCQSSITDTKMILRRAGLKEKECPHEEVAEEILKYKSSEKQTIGGGKGRWTLCRHCSMMFLIKGDGFYDSAPVLQDPITSSSLANRRHVERVSPV